jgi:hypothetical protein
MSDVQIIFANAKAPLAERLRETIARAGYDVAPGGGVAPDEVPAPGDADAILFLWDRSSIKQPGLQQAAAAARNRGRAIDVSADGITPVDLIDETRLVQLSAWRGEPTHPGWRKIVAELERLCGGHRTAAAPPRAAPPRAPAEPRSAAAPDAERGAPRGGAAKLAGICAAVLVALLLIGYFALSRRTAAPSNAPQAPGPAIAAAQPMATPASGTASAGQPQGPQAVDLVTSGSAAPTNVPSNGATPGAAQAQPALTDSGAGVNHSRATAPLRARATQPQLRGVVRYTKYAKTMRLFCQRSGRHTPQCRLFNRALAAGR